MEPGDPLPAWMQPAEVQLRAYARLLATSGAERGLIGPRELPRIWDRHLMNCAVVADPAVGLVKHGAQVADIGSGAGLPGIVWALVRPDIQVSLIEALLRRATFLEEVVVELGLQERVSVIRSRAEDCGRDGAWTGVDVVTARAVAPLPTLLRWMLPLAAASGLCLALKGARAADEVAAVEADPEWNQGSGGVKLSIAAIGEGILAQPTTVVVARRRRAQ